MTTSLKRKQQKAIEVEVKYYSNRVGISNLNKSDIWGIQEVLEMFYHNNYDTQIHLDLNYKGYFFLLTEIMYKVQRVTSKKLTLTIPQAVAFYNHFSDKYYLGTNVNYIAGLIHQKLS